MVSRAINGNGCPCTSKWKKSVRKRHLFAPKVFPHAFYGNHAGQRSAQSRPPRGTGRCGAGYARNLDKDQAGL
jgi:hypothetical protein